MATSATGPAAPSYRVRVLLLREALLAHGVAVESVPLFEAGEASRFRDAAPAEKARVLLTCAIRQRTALRRSSASTVLVSRQASLEPLLRSERAACEGRRLIYDVDDAVWHSTEREAGGHRLAFLKASRRKARWLARRGATVIAGNDILAEWLSAHSNNVVVVPSLVPPSATVRHHVAGEELVVGWIGSHSTVRHLDRIRPALSTLARRLRPQKLRLLMVGAPALAVPGACVEAVPWSEPAEREALARIDLGLMPLADTPWTRGKCAYKALQYMAAGIPVVADDVGISRSVVEGHGAGSVVTSERTWVSSMEDLLRDEVARNTLGAAGRRAVEQEFSPRRWIPTLAAVLRGNT